ncbi:nucleotide disphospho-sugar-binding domain-containing protein [Streptomyces armeniacus]|uniref:nucleotide disphospho-sugar-binding domain-containing protein n=1 Tax=Streptomyces armeniacus TaxID=83291 RepID=UPI001AD8373B|nr:nucleotide disphospho-sugar-binding domain-containing protein [Streptomyces armeniacus]
MRVLFIPLSVPTHYFHQVSMAWAFRAAGHEVRVAGEAPVLDAVLRSGMPAVPAGEGFDFVATDARGVRLEALPEDEARKRNEARLDEFGSAAAVLAGDLVRFAGRWRPDVVIADPMASVAPVVAETAGVPLVRHLFGPDLTRHLGYPGSGVPLDGDPRDAYPERILELYDRFGVEARADYALRHLDPTPAALQVPGMPNRLPVRYVPYNGPGVAPGWLRQPPARTRVCVTYGTVTSTLRGAEGFQVPRILRALTDLDVEVVAALSASDRELLGEPPAGVRVVEQLPLHLLLPSCAAIFHQGGAGALLTAAALGVPQVVGAQHTDQILNARQLESAGAGVFLPPGEADGDGIKKAVSHVLSDASVRAAAAEVRAEIQEQPTPAGVVRTLEELI